MCDENIDFSKLKECIKSKRTTINYVAEDTGLLRQHLSKIIKNETIPKTDTIAKICWVLKVNVSDIVELKGIKENKFFTWDHPLYWPSENTNGEVTYEPLWNLLEDYLSDKPGKTAGQLFDQIEPYRRKAGISLVGIQKALEARGINSDYEAKPRKRVTKGLPQLTRTKLKNDRPLSFRTIYDICNFLGCSPDFIMSYK